MVEKPTITSIYKLWRFMTLEYHVSIARLYTARDTGDISLPMDEASIKRFAEQAGLKRRGAISEKSLASQTKIAEEIRLLTAKRKRIENALSVESGKWIPHTVYQQDLTRRAAAFKMSLSHICEFRCAEWCRVALEGGADRLGEIVWSDIEDILHRYGKASKIKIHAASAGDSARVELINVEDGTENDD